MDAAFSVALASLRPLKNALRDAFPTAKSSHLSEALAVGLGYNTYAAQLAAHETALGNTLLTLTPRAFYARLQQLGYAVDATKSIAAIHVNATGPSQPDRFRTDKARLLEVLDSREPDSQKERARLRQRLSQQFGQQFGLGHVETTVSGGGVVAQLSVGIDYKTCAPDWGTTVNQNNTLVRFPGQDHEKYYYEYLPLASGKLVEYCSAVVSMPYLKEDGSVPELAEAQALASEIGWKVEHAHEWSWHMAGVTGLVIFRRTTSPAEMAQMWQTSFKKWLFENKQRLVNGRTWIRRQVVKDMLTCPHFPLDVANFEDLRTRYLVQYAPYLFYGRDHRITDLMKLLFDQWAAERKSEAV